jgi:NADH:ubiquinone oxidoreductase subunit 5 (subunit L)/multisubunit Na+/H+ antiporter MnhA subunit
VIGAVGKSAQLFLHVWLPDAMEGPTPVSALLHAATMVTAGVFLIVRNSSLFELAPDILFLILSVGTITTFFAATTGLVQYDLKRIIAFSTCSQLGYMFAACGVSGYAVSLFHLFNHAFFKALLFLAAGSIIHALADEQDIRRMGALAFYLPLTFSFFCVASLSLMGVPFLSGFYSKDLIIELQAGNYVQFSSFFFLLLVTSAVLTAFYSARLVFFVFLDKPQFNHILLHDASTWVQVPLLCLAILSIVSGFYF